MSFITQALIAEKYGFRLDTEALSELLGIAPGTIRNQLSAGTFPIPTYKDNGKQWADYRDAAAYIDQIHKTINAQQGEGACFNPSPSPGG